MNELIEKIAEQVHISWQEEKHRQGVYNHPDDLPYEVLADSVKEYDRVTVRTVLNALNKLGYNVVSK